MRDHLGVAQDRRTLRQRGARRHDQPVAEFDMPGRLDEAAGMDHAHRHPASAGEKRARSASADDGEERS
jgi:hypothetical protein